MLAVNGESSMWEAAQLTGKDPRGHIIGFNLCLTIQSRAGKVHVKALWLGEACLSAGAASRPEPVPQ